jgi:hypothetical protein
MSQTHLQSFLLVTSVASSFWSLDASVFLRYRIREAYSEALFSSFEFCADGFVDDTDRQRTKLSVTERIVSYLYHFSLDASYLKNIQGPNNLRNISQ